MAARKKVQTEPVSTLAGLAEREYATTKIVGSDGKTRHSKSNDDAVARAMLIFTAGGGDIAKVIKANGLSDKYDPAKYDNQGLLRMSVGNSLRALVRGGTPVTVGDITVKTLEQRIALPESVEKEKKARAKKAA